MTDGSMVSKRSVAKAGRLAQGWGVAITLLLILVAVIASSTVDAFATPTTARFVILDATPMLLIAAPLSLLIITGEIDISIASTLGLSAAVMGQLWTEHWPLPLIMILCVMLGGAAGAFNGYLVTHLGLPSLAVTIGTLALYSGLSQAILGNRSVGDFPQSWSTFVNSAFGATGIPYVMVPTLAIVLVCAFILHLSPLGRRLYAIGNSEAASAFSGVQVRRIKFLLFTATGVVSALAGVFWALQYNAVQSDTAQGYELNVIAAIVLGGVSIFGGRGGMLGVFSAALLLSALNEALLLKNVPSDALSVVTGILLIAAVVGPSAARFSRRVAGHRLPLTRVKS